MSTATPFASNLYVSLKPVGANCNLRCKYCYYLPKLSCYNGIISDTLLEKYISQYINAQTKAEIEFVWHGGEPLLLPLEFYKKCISLQKKHGAGRIIHNVLQTNGTLLTKELCKFFADNKWLIGVSIDGTENQHDTYRVYNNGKGSFTDVINGINLLNLYKVDWNIMSVIHKANVTEPNEYYSFIKSLGSQYIQFTPAIIWKDGETIEPSITAQEWGNFLCTIFELWRNGDVGKYFIQIIEATLANWIGISPSLCSLSSSCGQCGTMEYNGDIFSCDHFINEGDCIGNINDNTLIQLMYGNKQSSFGNKKTKELAVECRNCKYLFACNGECPKNRIPSTNRNILCEGYKKFFSHVDPYMQIMKNGL